MNWGEKIAERQPGDFQGQPGLGEGGYYVFALYEGWVSVRSLWRCQMVSSVGDSAPRHRFVIRWPD